MKASPGAASADFRNFRYKTPQLHWLLCASGVLLAGSVLAFVLGGVAVVLSAFLVPGLLPDPDTWPHLPILGGLIVCLFGGGTCMVVGEARLMGRLSIGPRYVICNRQIMYYRNVSEVVLEHGKQLKLQAQSGARLKIRRSRFFVLGRRPEEKTAERFDKAFELIRAHVQALSPDAVWTEIAQPVRPDKVLPPKAPPRQPAPRVRKARIRKTKR